MIFDLLIPARCAGCGTLGHPCCPRCSQVWGSLTEVVRGPVAGLAPVYALAPYRGPAKRLLIAYKERGRRDLAPPLGAAVASALRALPGRLSPGCRDASARSPAVPVPGCSPTGSFPADGLPADGLSMGELVVGGLVGGGVRPVRRRVWPTGPVPDRPPADSSVTGRFTGPRPWCLVPAPSRRSAARLRGGPHVALLAEHAARQLAAAGAPALVARALALKGARDAVGLTREQRIANLAGGLRFVPAGRPPPGTRVIVLDDVVTTGATAAACVRALAGAGVAVTAVVALLAAG